MSQSPQLSKSATKLQHFFELRKIFEINFYFFIQEYLHVCIFFCTFAAKFNGHNNEKVTLYLDFLPSLIVGKSDKSQGSSVFGRAFSSGSRHKSKSS